MDRSFSSSGRHLFKRVRTALSLMCLTCMSFPVMSPPLTIKTVLPVSATHSSPPLDQFAASTTFWMIAPESFLLPCPNMFATRLSPFKSCLSHFPVLAHNVLIRSSPRCLFNAEKSRWNNTKIPSLGSVIKFSGLCSRVLPSGLLAVDLDTILFGVGSHPSSTVPVPPQTPSPLKKRKFNAYPPEFQQTVAPSLAPPLLSPQEASSRWIAHLLSLFFPD